MDGRKTFLSLAGRITLIQICLSHILNYFLAPFQIPVLLAFKIEKLQRHFLWLGIKKGKKDYLIR